MLIDTIFSTFKPKPPPTESNDCQKIQRVKVAWVSLTIVLVLDSATKLILTGGSQPACYKSSLFKNTLDVVRNLRVRGEFAEVVKICSTDFAHRANEVKKAQGIEDKKKLSELTCSDIEKLDLYKRIVNSDEKELSVLTCSKFKKLYPCKAIVSKDKSDWYGVLSPPSKVFCWACEGSDFEFKAPCLRCQCFYQAWVFRKMPRDSVQKKDCLENDLFSSLDCLDPCIERWAYCAETTAASKLYLAFV